jgi:hypothetical protein
MRHIKRKPIAGLGLLMGVMVAGLVSSFAAPVRAQDSFGNQVIEFSEDTTVEFEFKESHGAYQSTLGIINLDTNQPVAVLFKEAKPYDAYGTGERQTRAPGSNNIGTRFDYLGTVDGATVPNRLAEFTFKANTRYGFYLESVSPTGQTRRTVLSSNNLAAAFDGSLDSGDRGGVIGSRIAWDDDGLPGARKDDDFDDFVIEAGGYQIQVACPPVK